MPWSPDLAGMSPTSERAAEKIGVSLRAHLFPRISATCRDGEPIGSAIESSS